MDERLRQLLERDEVVATVTKLFVCTDSRDWDGARSCFAERVFIDMSSLTGAEPFTVSAREITEGWEQAFRSLRAVHHQVGNFRVSLGEREANVACYGISYHHRPARSGHSTRTFVGTYDLHLSREDPGWKIDRFRFDCKFVEGRLDEVEDEDGIH